MAPLPYNSTSILRVQYEHLDFGQREMVFRAADGVSSNAMAETTATFLETVAVNLWYEDVQTVGATWQAAGTDFSLPIFFPALVGERGATLGAANVPRFVSFNARGTTTGREYKVGSYFVDLAVDTNYRYTQGESAQIDAVLLAWNAYCLDVNTCTIGGDQMQRRLYANCGYNAYWQRKLRTS